jgi:hypothetical protein
MSTFFVVRNLDAYLHLEPILRIVSYNASAVKIYNASSSLVRFENKNIFHYILWKKPL